jgi:transposase InsO family protein
VGLPAPPPRTRSPHASALAHSVAQDLAARGWKLKKVMTDNGSEFRATEFTRTVQELGAKHTFIHAGRPQTNGCVERAQQTLLEECSADPRDPDSG